MNKYEVSLQGMFRKEYFIEAENADEAEEKAKALFDKDIGLTSEDYVYDSITSIPEVY